MWLRTNYRAPYFLYGGNIGKMALYFPTDVSILSLSAKLSRIVFFTKTNLLICIFSNFFNDRRSDQPNLRSGRYFRFAR